MLSHRRNLAPRDQGHFQGVGAFPPQEPGFKFSHGVVFPSPKKSLLGGFVLRSRPGTFSSVERLQCFFYGPASSPQVSSAVELLTVYTGNCASVWTQIWEDTTVWQTMRFKPCTAFLLMLLHNLMLINQIDQYDNAVLYAVYPLSCRRRRL